MRQRVQERDARIGEAKGAFDLVEWDLPGDARDVLVEHAAHVVIIAEDERLLGPKANGDDVFCVLPCELLCLLNLELVFDEELLVICNNDQYETSNDTKTRRTCKLDDEWDIKDVLQPS